MTHDPAEGPRYATLRDYLRVLRAYRIMILAVALVGGGVALFLSLREDKVYQATSSIEFKDETSEFVIFGLSPNPPAPATQVAAAHAKTVTKPDVLAKASRQLGLLDLGASVSTSVDASSSLVNVSVRAGDPLRAARVANAVAKAAIQASNRELRARFIHAALAIRKQAGQLGKGIDAGTQIYAQSELTRLDSLSHFAQAASLVERAGVPGAPTSPQPVRSAILGVIGGLLAGLLLAFFRDSLDRRLRSAHDIEAHFGFPVLGYVRNEAMGHVAYIENGSGGNGGGIEQIDLEGFRIMRRNLDFLKPDANLRSILVTSAFPSEGKTTVSSSLALTMAIGGKRTLLVECDFRRPVLAKRFGIEPTPGLSDYLAGQAQPQEVLRTVEFKDPPLLNGAGPSQGPASLVYSLIVIPAGTATPHPAELLGSERLREFINQVTRGYDAVVIDSSPLLPVADTLELLPHVDGVIVCARELQTTREQARSARATLENLPDRPTALVVTGTRPHEDDYEGYAYSYAYQAQQ